CLSHASAATLGGPAHDVLPATVACREHRRGHEIDVVVVATAPGSARRVLAIGEVKSTRQPLDAAAVQRLDHLRDLVGAVAADWRGWLLFSRVGFPADARHLAADRDDVELIDLDRLYQGE